MDSHQDTTVVENSRINADDTLKNDETLTLWHRFWFDLKPCLHFSWVEGCDDKVLAGLFSGNEKSIAYWRSLYPRLCRHLELDARPSNADINRLGVWYSLAPKITGKRAIWLKTAGACALTDIKNHTDVAALYQLYRARDEHSAYNRKLAVQLSRSLSLYERCIGKVSSNQQEAGLWLLYQALKDNHPSVWQRLRVRFDKKSVLNIEKGDNKGIKDADIRTFKRLWDQLGTKIKQSSLKS